MHFLLNKRSNSLLFSIFLSFFLLSFSLASSSEEDEEKVDYFTREIEPLFYKWRPIPDVKFYTGLTASDTVVTYVDNLTKLQLQNLIREIKELHPLFENYDYPADVGHDIGFILQQKMNNITFETIREELEDDSEWIAFRATRQNGTAIDEREFDPQFMNINELRIQVGFSREDRDTFPHLLTKRELSRRVETIRRFLGNEGENTVFISVNNILFRNHLYLIEPFLNIKKDYPELVHIFAPSEQFINPSILGKFWEKTDCLLEK